MKKLTIRNLRKQAIDTRGAGGNMITMVALCLGLVVLLGLIAFGFYMLLSEQRKGQSQADKLALEFSRSLNDGDRVGQMNNVVARCRELVFVSRQSENLAQSKRLEFWAPLAHRLTEEARSSAVLVESERVNQLEMSRKALRALAESHNLHTKAESVLNLPWWKSYDESVFDVSGGYINNVQSNVLNSDVYPELRDFDQQEKYFEPGSSLYKGNINAKLPWPDNDLDFKLSSLAAPVEKTISPGRLVNPEVYKPTFTVFQDKKYFNLQKPDQLPSAVRILTQMDVAMGKDKNSLGIASTASTSGAAPPP